jgi:hypothetical protein
MTARHTGPGGGAPSITTKEAAPRLARHYGKPGGRCQNAGMPGG